MNNSKIVLDNSTEEDGKGQLETLEKQRGELSQIIEAINGVESSGDWQKLRRLVLDGVVKSLEKKILNENLKTEINLPELYRLQGQLSWAKKYTDLKKLADWYHYQIENIKNQINESSIPRDGAL